MDLRLLTMWLLVFFVTPIAEMYLLIEVGGYIGAWPTIGLVMLTAMIGVTLLRIQGLATLTRGLRRLDGGQLPAQEVVEGLLLAVAGALLLTPGFVTDAVGFLLLVPALRVRVAVQVLARVKITGLAAATARSGSSAGSGADIEGEFQRIYLPEDASEAPTEGPDPGKRGHRPSE